MHHRTFGDKVADWINVLLLILISMAMLIPFLYIFALSFSSTEDYLRSEFILWPKTWVLDSYAFILSNGKFVRSILVTIYIALVGTFFNLAFTSTLAYGLVKPFYGRKIFMFMTLFLFMFGPSMIPSYLMVKATGLIDSIWALIIPGLIGPFYVIIFRQFFQEIPEELSDSAVMDGANEFRIFRSIILPLSKPVMATFGLFYAVGHWNNYFAGVLYLNNPDKWPIQVLLRQIVVVNNNAAIASEQALIAPPPSETIQMAAVLLATVPILLVYPFLQKHFAKGVMIGSIKG